MIKHILIFSLMSLFSFSAFATSCPPATPTNDPGFCASFAVSANCHCREKSPSPRICTNMTLIYNLMIATYGSVQNACDLRVQRDVTQQECIDDWNCYLHGGVDSQGKACSGTGRACS